MLFIVEILFFIMGIYATITAKLPAWFVGKGYIAEGSTVRILGLAMAAPLPLAFCAGFVLALIDPDMVSIASVLEVLAIVVVSIASVFILRKIRKPETPPEIKS
jgi:hypothetical protein